MLALHRGLVDSMKQVADQTYRTTPLPLPPLTPPATRPPPVPTPRVLPPRPIPLPLAPLAPARDGSIDGRELLVGRGAENFDVLVLVGGFSTKVVSVVRNVASTSEGGARS